jgi:hypothetical protein
MNLFLSTCALTKGREDHLTEFLAAALTVDEDVKKAYAELVLRDYARNNDGSAPQIAEVSTQKSYQGTSCRPDMVLTLTDGHAITCEHKIESPETLGEEEVEGGATAQLQRYTAGRDILRC